MQTMYAALVSIYTVFQKSSSPTCWLLTLNWQLGNKMVNQHIVKTLNLFHCICVHAT